jgi:hypothetical protein
MPHTVEVSKAQELYTFAYMKIALAQLNYHIGNFESNTAHIRNHIA